MLIPDTLLIAACPFLAGLGAARVAHAIASGARAGGVASTDVCPIEGAARETPPAAVLDAISFDARMRRARAVVVAAWRLDRDTLRGSIVFEIATRARQTGVPAFAIAGENRLAAFDARILDLQVILEARDVRTLSKAGRELARML